MTTIFDVANYILTKAGPMSAMKLQKLVYYSQAWSLVWDDAALFDSEIQAWAFGPVSPVLYDAHRGKFELTKDFFSNGNIEHLTAEQKETIDVVLDFYGKYTGQQLSDLTHSEDPWKKAREGLSNLDRSDREITRAAMAEFYTALTSV